MSEIVITYAGATTIPGAPFVPCFEARRGETLVLKIWVELDGTGGAIVLKRLERDGVENPEDILRSVLLRYGVRRLEAMVQDLMTRDAELENGTERLQLSSSEVPILLALATEKSCSYQHRSGRDLFCLATSEQDKAAIHVIGDRRAAPTSRAVCSACRLPDADYLCSHLLHPATDSTRMFGGGYSRRVISVLCDLGKSQVQHGKECRAGGHPCWQRLVEAEVPAASTMLSPLSLPESFDALDALWRLTFGTHRRLLGRGPMVASATLTMDCANRAEFDSCMSALADVLARLDIEDDLLPEKPTQQEKTGTISRMQTALFRKLPAEQHDTLKAALRTIRRVIEVRTAMQHGKVDGGPTQKLHALGIHDAPPNWQGRGTPSARTLPVR